MSPKARGLLPAAALVLALVPAPVAASGSNPVCLDAPVSSAVMHPSSCIVTGPVSEVLAGTSAVESGAGAVALAGEAGADLWTFPGSGTITAAPLADGTICLTAASGAAAELGPNGALTAAPGGCGTAGAPALRPTTSPARAAATTAPAAASAAVPTSSMSYYVYAGAVSTCGPGATTGCSLYAAAAAEPAGSLVVLAFGAPCYGDANNGATYGTQVFGTRTCTPISQLLPVASAFARGYISKHGAGSRFILSVGTSNSLTAAVPGNVLAPANMQAHADLWYRSFVQPLQQQFPGITVWAGSDIEEESSGNFYDYAHTGPWVDQYSASSGHTAATPCDAAHPGMMADFGDDVEGGGGWTAQQIYHVAYGSPASCPVPEIYVSANATEWARLATDAQAPPIVFPALMSAGGWNGYLCSTKSWQALAGATGQNIPYLTVIGGTVGCGYGGYSILNQAGGIYSFGDAAYYGNLIDHHYPGPAIGLAGTPNGGGYAILNTGGGIYTFGNAQYFGNLIDHHYPGPAVAISSTPSGKGYAILTSTGALYTFGDALYFGNLLDHHFPGPAVSFAYTPDGRGYDILTASGAIYSFGDALYYGNLLDHGYPGPATALTYSINTGAGYAILTSPGGLFTFGDAIYLGNLLDHGYPGPAVAVSSTP